MEATRDNFFVDLKILARNFFFVKKIEHEEKKIKARVSFLGTNPKQFFFRVGCSRSDFFFEAKKKLKRLKLAKVGQLG